ncbi:MAG: tyrosine-type recombinase/integrase [Dysosmobacter welbionis]
MSKVTMRRPDARAMAQLLAEQTQTAAGLILRLAWRQGLTREEIQRLTWNDVDFSAHQLRLPDRTIPLETETEDCLRRQAERPDPPTPFVVVSDRRRQQMPPESISRLARKTLDRAGLGGISLMDLRHDFIIRHLESHDWPYVARISGIAVPTLYAVFSDYLPEGRQKDSLPRQEVDGFLMWKLLQAEGSSPVGLALWMGWKLGMQVREMTALTWDQVDLDRGLVRLPDRDLALGVTLRRLLRAAAGRRRPGEDPHVLLTPNSRRPLDQPRLSKMVRTALIRGGMEHISLGDLCREERRENEDARLLAYAAEKGTISRSEAMSLLGLSRWRPTSVSGSWLSGESWCGSAANTTPPARWCRRRSSMTSSVHFWSSPVRPTGRIWRRSCTSATDSVP